MADENPPALIEISERERSDSFYKYYAPLCALCHSPMDHPPIRLMIQAPVLKAPMGKDVPPMAEGEALPVCRHCVLEALAPMENPHDSNPRAGWYFRAILKGDFEPRGIASPRASGVGKEVGSDKEVGPSNTKSD